MPRRSRNAAFAAGLLTITRLRAHTDRACQGLLMEDCEARAGGLDALEDRNGLGWCPCWLRQLLLERSDGHRPDEVCGQREVHEGVVGRMDRDRAKTFFSTFGRGMKLRIFSAYSVNPLQYKEVREGLEGPAKGSELHVT